jgi:hypothetical protein
MPTETTEYGDNSSMKPALLARLRQLPISRTSVLWAGLVLNTEVALVLAYLLVFPGQITDPLVLVYPFVWINLGLWAVLHVDRPAASRRRHLTTGIVASVYFGVLLIVGGLIGPGHAFHGHSHGTASVRIAISSMPPGWSPAVLYGGDLLRVSLFPYKLVGYAALSYLVFVTLLDIDRSVLSGVLGFASCVSCTWPILGTMVTAVFGGGSVIATVATNQPYELSTLIFVTAVGLLVWRPFADWAVLSSIRNYR